MPEPEPGERWPNTVSADFDSQANARAAVQRLQAAGFRDCYWEEKGRHFVVSFDAGAREGLAREIVEESHGQERDLPA